MIARRSGLLAGVLLGLGWVAPLAAQAVRVDVTSEADRRPIAGALVTLTVGDRVVARALTDQQGRLVLSAEAGRYRLRVDAIGFEGKGDLEAVLGSGANPVVQVQLLPKPLQLEEVVVSEGPSACGTTARQGALVAQLWDEARKALLATQVTRASVPITVEVRTFERDLDPFERVVRETSAVRQGHTERPFQAIDPRQLHRKGYVEERDDGVWYHGPDADLLLSEEFLEDHCLSLGPERVENGERQVSLAFEPAPKRQLPDVAGKLWLDVATAELRDLEYRYRNVYLPLAAASVGGRIEFERLPSGSWIISNWVIRMPRLYQVRLTRGVRDSLAGFREAGGTAKPVDPRRRGGREGSGGVVGRVADSTTGVVLEGVTVSLQEGRFADTTDGRGRFTISAPGRGAYLLTVADPRFALFGLDSLRRGVTLQAGRPDSLEVAVPLLDRAVRTLCPADTARLDRGMLLGQVVDSASGRPVEQIAVSMRYRQGLTVSASGVSEQAVVLETTSDERGYFAACGLPVGGEVVLTIGAAGGRRVKRVEAVPASRLGLVTIRLP